MSLIHCVSNCKFQQDGYCHLNETTRVTNETDSSGCLHFMPKAQNVFSRDNGTDNFPKPVR